MQPVEQFPYDGMTAVTFAKDQPQYDPLPALVDREGVVLTEWQPSEAERAALARGENIRLWIWTCGRPLQPVALGVTDERKG